MDHQVAFENADPLSHAHQAETAAIVGDRIEAHTRVSDLQVHVVPFACQLN